MIGGIGNMSFSTYPKVSLVNLWDQVITPRGQILVSRTGDATLRVLCCVRLCVVRCALVVVVVCHADPSSSLSLPSFPSLRLHTHTRLSLSPCVDSKRHRVCRHHARMCYHMRAWCRHTRGRFESTHGFFQRVTPHTKNTHTHTTTLHNTA